MRRLTALASLVCVISLFSLAPVAAQTPSPATPSLAGWIPADFAGYIRLDMTDPGTANESVSMGAFIVSILQPTRVTLQSAVSLNTVLPVDVLDLENATFSSTILPWLGNELIIGYRALPDDFAAGTDDVLLILPMRGEFAGVSGLTSVIQGQDLLERDTYRGALLYRGDQTAIAVTPLAVLIGAEDLIQAALDTEAGALPAMTDDAVYTSVRGALPERAGIFAYFREDAARNGLAYVVNGGGDAASLLASIGDTASELSGRNTIETALLSSDVDAVGVALQLDTRLSGAVSGTAVVHTAETLDAPDPAVDPALMEYIPRSAMFVHSGTNAQTAAWITLSSLPLANFASEVVGGFPVAPTAASAQGALPRPSAQDVQGAVSGFAEALSAVQGIDLDEDVFGHLRGGYAFAMLPRPNNPLPVLNTPFDGLLVAQADDADTVLEMLADVFAAFVPAGQMGTDRLGDVAFTTITAPDTDEPILRIGAVGDVVMIASGDAAQQALNARRGDNRLIDQERWQMLNRHMFPTVYLDIAAAYNTFFPTSGGGLTNTSLRQVGIQSAALGDGLYALTLEITVNFS